jgi:hypothetical protein
VYVEPFQVYEPQAVAEDEEVELELIVKFNVAVLEQPDAFKDVYV